MAQSDMGTDLMLSPATALGTFDLTVWSGDLVTLSGLDNVAQALTMRLLTPQGELAHLGHPEYGSRLYVLIGRLLGPEVSALAAAYVRDALKRDARVDQIGEITVIPYPARNNTLWIEAELRVKLVQEPLRFTLSYELDS